MRSTIRTEGQNTQQIRAHQAKIGFSPKSLKKNMFALIGYSQERLLYVYLQTFLTFNQSKLNSCIVQDIRFFVDRFITYLAYNMRGLK